MVTRVRKKETRIICLTYVFTAKGSPSPSSSSFPSGSSLTKSHNLSKISIEIKKNNYLLSSERCTENYLGVGGGGGKVAITSNLTIKASRFTTQVKKDEKTKEKRSEGEVKEKFSTHQI